MGALTSVHGKTTNLRSPSKPSRTSSFAKRFKVLLDVAGYANRAARFWVDFADFSTLQTNDDALRHHALRLLDLLLVHDNGICTGAAAEYTPTLCFGANVKHLRTKRYHVDG
jgi:hypothetical protein